MKRERYEYNKQFRAKNKDKIEARRKAWIAANREKNRQTKARWDKRNKERYQSYDLKWLLHNPSASLFRRMISLEEFPDWDKLPCNTLRPDQMLELKEMALAA